ncbi:hypothetical protein S4A8_02783 [Salinisphaera sp. S4-8]|uniref:hypothetical protein n=1 Tax=Salinisphaera sp. S4-8 TaxID=633357 RepID=UPI0033402115
MSYKEVLAVIVLALAAAAAAGFYFRRPVVSALASLLCLLYVCFLLFAFISARSEKDPAEFSALMVMSMSWGWLFMVGSGLVMAGASFKARRVRRENASEISA